MRIAMLTLLLPDRLPSLIVLVAFWIPPAIAGWVAAVFIQRSTKSYRVPVTLALLATFVLGYAAAWFFFNLGRMPPYIPGASTDPTFAPPKAVIGLAVVTSALVLPGSALACALAFRCRRRMQGIVFAAMMIAIWPLSVLGQEVKAPQFALKDVNGRTVRLSDYHGKVVLINFWATWCPPCRVEVPDLVRLQNEHGKQGLQIIGITYPPERKTRVQKFARSQKVNYPMILGTRETKNRFSSDETLPLTVVINRDGKVSDIISGILLREEFEEKIKPLLMRKMEGEIRNAKSDH